MRRIILLVFLALALPATTLAKSLPFVIPAGAFNDGFMDAHFASQWFARMQSRPSATNIAIVVFGDVTQPCGVGATCRLTNGSVRVESLQPEATLFMSSLSFGEVTRVSSTLVRVYGTLTDVPFGFVRMSFTTTQSGTMLSGSAVVATPEPSTLLTFGTGLLGLVGTIRRKLKRAT